MIQAPEHRDAHVWTADEIVARFGPIPMSRIRTDPPPGMATEEDVIDIEARENRLFELIHGVLVEKDMGYFESVLTVELLTLINSFVRKHNLGMVAGEGGMLTFDVGLIYIPDISFASWERIGTVDVRRRAVPRVIPDLAVEVISRGNTKKEMEDKLDDYFDKGVRLVWYVYPRSEEIHVYVARENPTVLQKSDKLDGLDVLPGFSVDVAAIFNIPQKPNPSP
ncbi:MAG: Uma2 family endonuclease [Phycisphaeraceae bacterium]